MAKALRHKVYTHIIRIISTNIHLLLQIISIIGNWVYPQYLGKMALLLGLAHERQFSDNSVSLANHVEWQACEGKTELLTSA